MRRGGVCVFDRCLSTVLSSWCGVSIVRVLHRVIKRTFSEHRQVDFSDIPVEPKYCAEVCLDDITGEIGDYDYLGVWLVKAISIVHLNVLIVQRMRGG